MPYADVSKYVLASEAIPEIARCYFGGDTNKAESDARIAARDGALPVFLDTPVFLQINQDRWYHDHIHWSSISVPLYFPRANLLKIYPDLWRSLQSPDNETTSTSTAGAVRSAAVNVDAAERLPVDETKGSDQAADGALTTEANDPGRPSRRAEIADACRELISSKKANLDSRTPNYEPIRQIIRRERGLPPEAYVAGLGDEAIRKVIAPILDNALAKLNEAKKHVP